MELSMHTGSDTGGKTFSQYLRLKKALTLLYMCHYNATAMKHNGG